MARIRTVKPEFWTSEQIVSCSRDARLLFIGIWNFCDDGGVHPKSYKRLKMQVLPGDNCTEQEIVGFVDELIKNGLLLEYNLDQKTYWLVTGWKSHQKIDKPNYRYPVPNLHGIKTEDKSLDIRIDLDESSSNKPLAFLEHSASSTPRNGRESKGKEEYRSDFSIDNNKAINHEGVSVNCGTFPQMEAEVAEINNASLEVPEEPIVSAIFIHWKTIMQRPRAKFDESRKKKIRAALKLGYSMDELKQAIDGCSKSPFHMGQNPQKQKYNELNVILRDSQHIEQFIQRATFTDSEIEDSVIDRLCAGAI